ncbi:MAG TPA: cob(I)yrinic acid a,c-diamide adenosyltransferase [Candidatus Sulfopaludibacter sp.]|nr:cob(I)yrinic acid a,c-diamide adenosyltransferase [Candidatus Sulfopaludibacter sp.]
MKIYTRTGDNGETSLFNGIRVKKNNKRIITYGTIDEVNSHLGVLLYYIRQDERLKDIEDLLFKTQNQLFILGSDLANPDTKSNDYPRINNEDVIFIEKTIDKLEETLEPLKSFILPGGSIEASYCHIIRTVVRRAEVNITSLFLDGDINKNCLIYLNRLSDLFFILSRVINKRKNFQDIPWKPS